MLLAGCSAGTTATGSDTSSASASSSTASATATTDTGSAATESGGTQATIAQTTAAVEAFMSTLSDEQKETLLYDYTDETKNTSWSNFPVTFVQRSGLNLHDLTDEQKQAALKVLEGLLNDEAYTQVVNIMNGDQYLLDYSSTTETSLGQYYIAFFGDPSDTSAWAIQFGGHHLGFNADLNGSADTITFAPTHLGSQPYS